MRLGNKLDNNGNYVRGDIIVGGDDDNSHYGQTARDNDTWRKKHNMKQRRINRKAKIDASRCIL